MSENYQVKYGSIAGAEGRNHDQGSIVAGWYLVNAGRNVARLLELGAIMPTDLPCTDDMGPVNPRTEIDPSPDLQREIDRLRVELKTYAQANFALEQKLSEASRRDGAVGVEFANKATEIERLMKLAADRKAQLDAREREIAELREEISELREEHELLKKDMESATSPAVR